MKKPYFLFHFFLFFIFYLGTAISSASQISYSDHCSSFVPESSPKKYPFSHHPLGSFHHVYHTGVNSLSSRSLSPSFFDFFDLKIQDVYSTGTRGVLKVEAELTVSSEHGRNCTNGEAHRRPLSPLLTFSLEGFWSESSGKLCMLGSTRMTQGDLIDLKAVLKLENVRNSSTITSLITGTLSSLSATDDCTYFAPISVFILPQLSQDVYYEYSFIPEENYGDPASRGDAVRSLPLELLPRSIFCGRSIWNEGFSLEYARGCESARNCSPLSGIDGYTPNVLAIRGYGCQGKRLRVSIQFSRDHSRQVYDSVDPQKTLVGEAYWDDSKLSIYACRILDVNESLASAPVPDCSTRLSLWFPEVLTIRENSDKVGQIWTSKSANHSDYFERIMFRSLEQKRIFRDRHYISGRKYEYTQADKVTKTCPKPAPFKNNTERYPDPNSDNMGFSMWVRDSTGIIAWGDAIYPDEGLVSAEGYFGEASLPSSMVVQGFDDLNNSNSSSLNARYKFAIALLPRVQLGNRTSLLNGSSILDNQVQISAEGIYDINSGSLCMVGCRNLDKSHDQTDNMDCEILLKFRFPTQEKMRKDGSVKGRIQSMRKDSDPLFFEPLRVSSASLWKILAQMVKKKYSSV
ncbi:hypothetical protein Tsubulata_020936 [Turnera subulata]|uniref:DUF2921 domain-containing protein n=1 Tax=Turnera subulata TaxID=218843 RepID=A0A9Q0G547_9ROSI|nr:hypothetical protein Tsubulata_020936 [Turnera subulata]